jgi:ligand-binding sensor domain-containing protein
MSRFDRPSGRLRLYTLPNGRVSAFLSAFLLLTLVSVSVAQETDVPRTLNFHRWGSVTVFNGLPSDAVRAISQTQDGVMWFGTDNGVARFDGRRVQTFAFDDPESNRIVTLKTDAEGNLWVGTHNGAFVYSAHGFQPVAGTENLTAACLLFGDETLIGTGQGFIMRVGTRRDGSRYAERISPGTIANSDGEPLIITSLIRDGARLIAATAGRGLMAFKDGRFAEVASASANVNAAVTAKDGRIWFGRDDLRVGGRRLRHLGWNGEVRFVSFYGRKARRIVHARKHLRRFAFEHHFRHLPRPRRRRLGRHQSRRQPLRPAWSPSGNRIR